MSYVATDSIDRVVLMRRTEISVKIDQCMGSRYDISLRGDSALRPGLIFEAWLDNWAIALTLESPIPVHALVPDTA